MNDALDVVEGDLLVVDGRIAAVGHVDASRACRPARASIDAAGALVLPGFVQTHIHLCQTLFRGLADDLPLLDWLRRRVWPLEAAHTPATLRGGRAARRRRAAAYRARPRVLTMETVHDTDAVVEARGRARACGRPSASA